MKLLTREYVNSERFVRERYSSKQQIITQNGLKSFPVQLTLTSPLKC